MQPPLNVLVAGASGFLGTHLVARLREGGHGVTTLVRRPAGPGEIRWDPYSGVLDPAVLDGVDVVVNLAGSPLVGNVHSRRWAEQVMESRVRTTSVLAAAIAARAGAGEALPAFVAGNGISYYGDHGDTVLTEAAASQGDALLTRVTRAWQEATAPAASAGARVCVVRTAVVLDAESSPFRFMRPLYRAGLGARLGRGRQYFPVVSRHDWVEAVTFLVTSQVAGAFNVVAPIPPTQNQFCAAIAGSRPVLARVPAPVVAWAAGAMGPELLNSVRAVPAALEEAGFAFRDRDVSDIVSAALGER